jgi:hypothetical protein
LSKLFPNQTIQEVSNLIPKSPLNLAYYCVQLHYYSGLEILENSHCALYSAVQCSAMQCSACHLHILLCTAESRLSLCQLIDRRVEACHALVRSPRPPPGSDLRAVGTGGHRGACGTCSSPPPTQYDKEADFKSNISLHLRVPYSNNFFYSFLH